MSRTTILENKENLKTPGMFIAFAFQQNSYVSQ